MALNDIFCETAMRLKSGANRKCLAHPIKPPTNCHSITSSARTKNNSGIVIPSAFAVARLTTSSKSRRLLDRHIGRVAALKDLGHEERSLPKDVGTIGAV